MTNHINGESNSNHQVYISNINITVKIIKDRNYKKCTQRFLGMIFPKKKKYEKDH